MSQPDSSKDRTPHVSTPRQRVKEPRFQRGIHNDPSGESETSVGSRAVIVIKDQAAARRHAGLFWSLEEQQVEMLPLKKSRQLQMLKGRKNLIQALAGVEYPPTATPTFAGRDVALYWGKQSGVSVAIEREKIARSLAPRAARESDKKAKVIDDIIRNVGTSETFSFEATYQRMSAEADKVRAVLNEVKAQKAAAKAAAAQR